MCQIALLWVSLMISVSIEWLYQFFIFSAQVRSLSIVMNVSMQQQTTILSDGTRCATLEISRTSVHIAPMHVFNPAHTKLT
jgi:hypothetical protein